jgi:hypothetical protein
LGSSIQSFAFGRSDGGVDGSHVFFPWCGYLHAITRFVSDAPNPKPDLDLRHAQIRAHTHPHMPTTLNFSGLV